MTNYNYRFLDQSDFDSFIDLHKSKNRFMNNQLSEIEKEAYLDRLVWSYQQDNYKVAGCFYDDKLIGVVGGRFFKEFTTWYVHGQCFNFNNDSLFQAKLFFKVQYDLLRKLTLHGEQLGIYQFYQARELQEGKIEFEFHDRLMEKGRLPLNDRYTFFWDKIYRPGDAILEPHKFFFRPDMVVKIPVLVSLNLLKQEYRKEYLE